MKKKEDLYKQNQKIVRKRWRNILLGNILMPLTIIIIIVLLTINEISLTSFSSNIIITLTIISITIIIFLMWVIYGFRKLKVLSPLNIKRDKIIFPINPPLIRSFNKNKMILPLQDIDNIKIRKRPFPFNDAFFEIKLKKSLEGKIQYQLKIKDEEIDNVIKSLDQLSINYKVTGLYG